MLRLVISAPNKQKVELECQPSDTFADVKVGVEKALGVPPDKQRLLCNGKERKDAKETLAAAGVTAKSKLMLMLAPGAPAPVDVEGTLPRPEGVTEGEPGTVLVRQGPNRYRIRVPQGLAAASFCELAEYLSAELLPRGIPASELRLICRGRTVTPTDVLLPGGGSELSVILLFRENFHAAAEGAAWLRERSAELGEAEVQIAKLRKRIEANFSDAETSVQLAEVGALVETLRQSVESVRVSDAKLPEMQHFRDRVLAADAQLEKLRKGVRL
mmetsp:Transcript_61401/g.170249  ORF Transcript_61401/g.170249 Transcript_61401/m.170249 type:complete len:272 (+) Transcript_61401:122-937(+)